MAAMEDRLSRMENGMAQIVAEMNSYAKTLNDQKNALLGDLNAELDKHKSVMGKIIEGARTEFNDLKG